MYIVYFDNLIAWKGIYLRINIFPKFEAFPGYHLEENQMLLNWLYDGNHSYVLIASATPDKENNDKMISLIKTER